ncbi:hypothetical protein RJ640_003193 [Escallonia rubra]|uniref:Transposase (putative) gypsy type domain-containing protein n=1 Tax=Escallonia rubra TaxID=112253 RepID=A0AA88R436_9ASTE|nr:hypothetical protein RJ640_003193 [Escallonia rubra]
MTKEEIKELLEEFPLPPGFSAQVPEIQEPANYGTDLETCIYEGHIRSGYRFPLHPFDLAFFNHYKMTPSQLLSNGWRKLVGLIYLVQTSRYKVEVKEFMKLNVWEERKRKGPLSGTRVEGVQGEKEGQGGRRCAPGPQEARAPGLIVSPLVTESVHIDEDLIFRPSGRLGWAMQACLAPTSPNNP